MIYLKELSKKFPRQWTEVAKKMNERFSASGAETFTSAMVRNKIFRREDLHNTNRKSATGRENLCRICGEKKRGHFCSGKKPEQPVDDGMRVDDGTHHLPVDETENGTRSASPVVDDETEQGVDDGMRVDGTRSASPNGSVD